MGQNNRALKIYIAKIPMYLIGSGMIRKCKVKAHSLCKAGKCEEGAISGATVRRR